ncbi:hypothetical protein JMJ56_32860 [Belnapia sp. T18]|uniref:Transposase n=1 Tax=Belnapia arida TaxID=2804533 RepID=A0ABS1UDK4_9PROT|nr:hypothetical protein [Belnapia arida]
MRRAGVTVAAGAPQKAGLIRYGGSHITITDRPGHEAVACECYGITRHARDRLFGLPPILLLMSLGRKKRYAGLETDQVREFKQLTEANARLKRLVAELSLDKAVLQDVLSQKFPGQRS